MAWQETSRIVSTTRWSVEVIVYTQLRKMSQNKSIWMEFCTSSLTQNTQLGTERLVIEVLFKFGSLMYYTPSRKLQNGESSCSCNSKNMPVNAILKLVVWFMLLSLSSRRAKESWALLLALNCQSYRLLPGLHLSHANEPWASVVHVVARRSGYTPRGVWHAVVSSKRLHKPPQILMMW